MTGWENEGFSLWWAVPLAMFIICIFMMRRKRARWMCGFGSRETKDQSLKDSDSAMEILDKRFALGEINGEEYREMKKALSHQIE
jgi:uncharacterized membrane protein